MRNILEILEDKKFYNMHKLFEMATISRAEDKLPQNTKVCVYGENDEQGTKVPHFHVIIDNGKIEFEIYIKNGYELNIWRSKNKKYKDWSNHNNVKKAVIDFLKKKHRKFTNITNLEYIIQVWNDNNPTNEIDDDYINS